MSAITREELWQRLQKKALVEGDLPPAVAASSPWYVRTMLGIAGWIGALFLLGFVGAGFAFVMKSAATSMTLGALACGAAFLIFRTARDNDFATQFGLAVSLAGQAMFAIGLNEAFRLDAPAAAFMLAGFEVALAALVPNAIHRVFTSGAAAITLSYALNRIGIHGLAPTLAAACMAMVWLDARRWAANGEVWRPIGYGLALALLALELTGLAGMRLGYSRSGAFDWFVQYGLWIDAALVTVVLVWTVSRLLAREGAPFSGTAGKAVIAAAVVVGIVSLPAPGVAGALLILLLGFASGSRVLMGLGVIGLLGFVSHYYYQLQTTLLVKSAVLAATGAALLAARLALHKWFAFSESEVPHA